MKRRSNQGLSLLELLVTVVILSMIVVPIINFYNAALRNTVKTQETTKLKFLAEEEMEKFISLEYNDRLLQAFSNSTGVTNFFERGEYLIKTNVIFIDPATGEVPELYPNQEKDDTFLKQITVSVARKNRMGGQVDLIYLKSP
jgi:prepilin-type N-terminal cleavage/methylation domain-containing protein